MQAFERRSSQVRSCQLQFARVPPIFGVRLSRDPPSRKGRAQRGAWRGTRTIPRFRFHQWIPHMASRSKQLRIGIQVVLVIVILGLSYFLYYSITEPYDRIERQQELTERTRARMNNIRTALIDYERDSTSFPDSLDILLEHIRDDSMLSNAQDSVFGGPVNLDSLFYSPRTGNRFQYAVSDTGQVETYLLEDPDSDDQIGTLSGDPTQTNSASWE